MKRVAVVSSMGLVTFAALGLMFACGPKEPPKQAEIPEAPDPSGEPSTNNPSSGSGGGSSGGGNFGGPGKGGPAGKTAKGEAPQVSTLAEFQEGLRWGMTHAEVTKMFTETGGVIWKDYDEKLKKARVGPEQTALEAEREQMKAAFGRSLIEFKDTPTGYDATGIKNEFTYRNKESLMWVQRQGKKRYFFFINDRLWKVYDEFALSDSGIYGKTFLDAVNTLGAKLGAQGRVLQVDPAKGVDAPTVDWKDSSSHLRAIDRSGEHVVGLALEDANTLANISTYRANKAADPTEIDPSITAVTKGTNRTDPNAAGSASASAAKKPAPPPKKK